MASSDDADKNISQLHQVLVSAYQKKFRFLLGRERGVCAERDARKMVLVNKRDKA